MTRITIQLDFDFARVCSSDRSDLEDAIERACTEAVEANTDTCDHCGDDIFDGIGSECNVHGDTICAECVTDHVEIDGEFVPEDEVAACDGCGDYLHLESAIVDHSGDGVYCCDYCVPERTGLCGYHSESRTIDPTCEEHPYLMGIEIEKEDSVWRDKLECDAVELPRGWIPEEDSSLDCRTGFELVTPAYNVTGNRDQLTADMEEMRDIIGGCTSTSCGGHITISRRGWTGAQMLDHVEPLCSMLCALYPKRLKNLFCRSRDKDECKQGDKYSPFRVSRDRLELRIFPQIRSHAQLMRRIELVELFLADSHEEIDWVAEFERGHIQRMFADVYTPEQWREKCQLRDQFSHWFGTGEIADTIAEFMYG